MNDCNPFCVSIRFPQRAPFNVLSSWIVFNTAFCIAFLQANTQCLMNVIPFCTGVTSVLVSGSIFDPHVGLHRSVVEFVCRFDVRDSAIDFGDDRPSRKIRQNVVFVMITNGKRQGHQGHFPILFFQAESIG